MPDKEDGGNGKDIGPVCNRLVLSLCASLLLPLPLCMCHSLERLEIDMILAKHIASATSVRRQPGFALTST